MISPGHISIGCESAHSALVDTGAQVCLFSKLSMLKALAPSPYTGPPLRGADNAFVECKSAASFTVHFDLSAMLPCLDRRIMEVSQPPLRCKRCLRMAACLCAFGRSIFSWRGRRE